MNTATTADPKVPTRRPNFLIIMTDQHRADHLGCAGNTLLKTPHIDALAAGGRMYKNFYVSTPICMPNRATFFTGRLPSLHGAHCNGAPLDLQANTFPTMLRASGYNTELVGKVHLQNMTGRPASMPRATQLGSPPAPGLAEAKLNMFSTGRYDQEDTVKWAQNPSHGLDLPYYGFDKVSLCTMHGDVVGGEYARWLKERCPDYPQLIGPKNALADNRYSVPQAYRTQLPEQFYPTNYVGEQAQQALVRLAKDTDKPFLLTVCYPDPHHPFTPPGRYWDMYDPKDVVLPKSFGSSAGSPAVQALRNSREQGMANTQGTTPFAVTEREAQEAIALTYGMVSMVDDSVGQILATLKATGLADNTVVIFTSDHGDFMGDHGLMLKSALHYQGLIRVPFIWWEQSMSQPGRATQALHSTLDVGRTLLARAGLAPYWGMQGQAMGASLNDPASQGGDAVMVEEDGHEISPGFNHPVRIRTLVFQDWRLSIYDGEDWGELYDLANDPEELVNRFSDPSAQTMKHKLFERMAYLLMENADRSPYPTGRA